MSVSPLSTSNNANNNTTSNSNAITNPSVGATSSISVSTGNSLPVQSPSTFKNLLGHHKKPSQSSLVLGNILQSSQNNSISQPNMIQQIGSNNNNNNNDQQANSNNTSTSNNTAANNNNQLQIEDIEIMKQRSANNSTFLCIKIPEIQLLVSYRGSNKDKKNIKDLTQVSLLFPLFEVHDKTWTWLDLINALKSHVKKALLSQALKHKLIKVPIKPVNKLINRRKRSNSQQHMSNLKIDDENEKLTISKLFGAKFIESKTKSQQQQQSPNIFTGNKEDSSVTRVSANDEVGEEGDEGEVVEILDKKRKSNLVKSNSTLSNGIKKRFLKLTKDKTAPSNLKSDQSFDSQSKKFEKIYNNNRKSAPK
jgi:hypothetical protein